MFEFKGRKLNISSELLSDNKRYRGCSLSEERARTYLINRYGEDDIDNIIDNKTNAELEAAINDGLGSEIQVFRGEGLHV